ncbi:hypothetical protein BB560_003662 [Smittium megazygosporum]|uniref:NTF2 domain-containing protein n=1 Tax=Smittium megazygosporum TaxID=133381 RepID=A0A2T9ZBE5_9FUNG|nr:hypothetical protein BB560_003662 [Smittium megazygosporum]
MATDSVQAQTSDTKRSVSAENSIGWYFVKEFYTTLNNSPSLMHDFYAEESSCIYGSEGDSVTPAKGIHAISQLFSSFGFKNCKVRISNVDSVGLDANTILVQALGEIANDGENIKKFVQTFVLVKSQNAYFCKSDIMRYLKDGNEQSSITDVDAWEEADSSSIEKAAAEQATPTEQPKPADKHASESAPVQTPQVAFPIAHPAPPPQKAIFPTPSVSQDAKVASQASAPASATIPVPVHVTLPESKPPVSEPSSSSSESQPQPKNAPKPHPVPAPSAAQPAPEKKPASAEQSSAPQPVPETSAQPTAIKSWANLAANNPSKWGSAVANVEGTVSVAQQNQASQPGSGQNGFHRGSGPSDKPKHHKKRENFPVYVKSIPAKADAAILKKAFSKFGPVASAEFQNTGNAVVDFITAESQKSALNEKTLVITLPNNTATFTLSIEERRAPHARRDDYKGARGSGSGSGSGRGNADFDRSERSSSGRGRGGNKQKPGSR